MSAQIIQFPTSHLRVCRWVNGQIVYRVVAGSVAPPGWSFVMHRVHEHKGRTGDAA
jgi:hypothetical protein